MRHGNKSQGKYFRGRIFSREDIFARRYFRGKIFSREQYIRENFFSRIYFKFTFREIFLPRKYSVIQYTHKLRHVRSVSVCEVQVKGISYRCRPYTANGDVPQYRNTHSLRHRLHCRCVSSMCYGNVLSIERYGSVFFDIEGPARIRPCRTGHTSDGQSCFTTRSCTGHNR